VLGLYFSASWCPACRSATPALAQAYKALRARGKQLQIVFVSQDSSEADFESYRATMPWLAMPHGGNLPALLAALYHVSAIPCLVLLDAEGTLVSTDGLRLLRKHTRAFPWKSHAPPATPHVHPLYARLLRHQPVDAGVARELPRYTPVDFLQQPARVRTLEDAIAATRHCDRLCTLLAVQSHCVRNTPFLKVALVQHTFTQLLPLPRPHGAADGAACVWRTPMLYATQLDLLLLLQRLMEHFAASVFCLDHTQPIDAVRMVVPACIAVVADAVMRQVATDIPSEVSIHLRGVDGKHKGFALDAAALARQAAIVPCHTAELNTARACALDYLAAQQPLLKIFPWEKSERLEKDTAKWLRHIARDLAFPADAYSLASYVADPRALLIKYPKPGAQSPGLADRRFVDTHASGATPRQELSRVSLLPRRRILLQALPQPADGPLPAEVDLVPEGRRADVLVR
jgi:thiol-disulfide isomerase/thioredoxin